MSSVGLPSARKTWTSWREANGGSKMVGGLEYLPCEERLRETDLVLGDLISVFQHINT